MALAGARVGGRRTGARRGDRMGGVAGQQHGCIIAADRFRSTATGRRCVGRAGECGGGGFTAARTGAARTIVGDGRRCSADHLAADGVSAVRLGGTARRPGHPALRRRRVDLRDGERGGVSSRATPDGAPRRCRSGGIAS
eukprot:ctg_1234.g270